MANRDGDWTIVPATDATFGLLHRRSSDQVQPIADQPAVEWEAQSVPTTSTTMSTDTSWGDEEPQAVAVHVAGLVPAGESGSSGIIYEDDEDAWTISEGEVMEQKVTPEMCERLALLGSLTPSSCCSLDYRLAERYWARRGRLQRPVSPEPAYRVRSPMRHRRAASDA